ncbi:MAG: hypothetical protein GOU99_03650 [Candidatus Altiarchaeota archaeon]|nr:hypothetical protein [Candidatus Altiarchaeota archaeon]
MDQKMMWTGAGIGVVLLLVITTPGWEKVMGFELNLGGYLPALILLGFMGAMIFWAVGGGGSKED